MSREILFRGKRVDNGKWIEGFYAKSGDKIFILVDNDFAFGYVVMKEVITKTVGQFTGLTDKNGKKIFEGDIIKSITLDTNTERLAVVGLGKFIDENNDDEYLGFYIEFDGFRTTITQLEMEEVKDRFEVIGNIHDNPEFLGE